MIKSANVQVTGEDISKIFEIESLESGEYYLDAWIMVPDDYSEYKVEVNGILSPSTLKHYTGNWQCVALTDARKSAATVQLKKGKNTISIIGKMPTVPNVEFVKLSSSRINAGISDSKYKAFVESIKSNALVATPSSFSRDSLSLRAMGTNGEIYTYQLDMPVTYTTYMSFNYTSGQSVSISTTSSNFAHIIEFFSSANPASYSWMTFAYDGSGSLSVTIPANGFYILRIRTYKQNTSGLVNLTINGSSYSNCIAAGLGLRISGSYSTNYFTCKSTNGGDVRLWMEDYSGLPGKTVAYNDDYGFTSDGYSWGLESRIVTPLSNLGAGLISAYGSNTPNFNCDLYLGVEPSSSTVRGYFSNLAADNSFRSAPESGVYNCISWSVGKTSTWDWPSNSSLSAWDNYYQGYGYTRSGATVSNAAIALWMYNGIFTHASVRKNSVITKPHGFEWESKCGSLERVMHIRDALSGNSYGGIVYYYKPINGTLSTAPALDTNDTYFISSDLNQIAVLKNQLSSTVISGFEAKYFAWKSTWNKPEIALYSNPYKYAESEEYNSLLKYCIKYGKATWPLFIDKLAQGDIFVANLLKDLTYNEEKDFIDGITPSVTVEVGKPVPSLHSNLVEYSKKLLTKELTNIQKSIQDILVMEENGKFGEITARRSSNNEIVLNFNAMENGNAFVQIYDLFGALVYEKNYIVFKGTQTLVINASNLSSGIHVIQVSIGGQLVSKKIQL